MKSVTEDRAQVVDALEALRQELTRLGERIAALEAAAGRGPAWQAGVWSEGERIAALEAAGAKPRAAAAAPPPAAAPATPPATGTEGLSEELILVIAAAIAAFLGKKPHIRQIRLLESADWAQEGRVTIQASHALKAHRG
jgi:methylmalonyl-CoA carboxyltransferase large subunit